MSGLKTPAGKHNEAQEEKVAQSLGSGQECWGPLVGAQKGTFLMRLPEARRALAVPVSPPRTAGVGAPSHFMDEEEAQGGWVPAPDL